MIAKKGHNTTGSIAADQLKSIIARVENLTDEKKVLAGDIRDIFNEAKGAGFDVAVIRVLIKQRAQDAADREEFELMLGTYQRALGMTPAPEGEGY